MNVMANVTLSWRMLLFHGEFYSFMANVTLSWRMLFSFMANVTLSWRMLLFHGECYSFMANVTLSWRILLNVTLSSKKLRLFWTKLLFRKTEGIDRPIFVTNRTSDIIFCAYHPGKECI